MKENSIKSIEYSNKFLKQATKLTAETIKKAKEKELIFRGNHFDPRLKTHKLSGKNKDCRAFWIDYHNRIKFVFLKQKEVLFLEIGPHKIYK